MSDELMELSEGWEWAKLGDILSILSGEAFKKKDYSASGVKLLQIANVSFGKVIWEQQNFLPEEFLSKYPELVLEKGDIVMALNRPILNGLLKIACLKEDDAPAVLYQRVARFNLILNEMREYFFNYTGSPLFLQLIRNNLQGSDQPYINTSTLPAFLIPLPPLNEQKRIVAAIESLRERSQKARSALAAIPELCNKFRQSVLAAAFRGDLTADWREQNPDVESASKSLRLVHKKWQEQYEEGCLQAKLDKEAKPKRPIYLDFKLEESIEEPENIPKNWVRAPIGLICDCIVPGRDKPKSFSGSIPWITIPDIASNEIDKSLSNLCLSEEEIQEVNARIIPANSVVMSCVGRFGISAIAKTPIVINQQLHAFLKSQLILPKYLMYHIRVLVDYMNNLATATTISYLNKSNCNSLPINLPPLLEQVEIVRRIDDLFRITDQMEQQYQKSEEWIEQLNRSILAKAFRGELVEQDPNDEPASVLLERIRVDREQQMQGKIKKPGKKKRTGD